MALNDFTGQNIQDTYKKLVQTEGNTFADGSGSAITTFNVTSSHAISASYALSASHEITYELSSSHAETADALTPGIDIDVRNITASGNISASGYITSKYIRMSGPEGAGTHRFIVAPPFQETDLDAILLGGNVRIAQKQAQIAVGITPSAGTDYGNLSVLGHVSASELQSNTWVIPEAGAGSRPYLSYDTSTDYLELGGAAQVGAYPTKGIKFYTSGSSVNGFGSIFFGGDTGYIEADGYISGSEFRTTGNITASGNISSSGIITGQKLQIEDLSPIYRNNADGLNFGQSGTRLSINLANITASGNISSSGVIISSQYEFGYGGSAAYLQATDISSLTSKFVNNYFHGHITASGNISASGNIIADKMYFQNELNPGTNYLEWDGTGLHYNGSSHINGNITASGNISSSNGINGFAYKIQNLTIADYDTIAGARIGIYNQANLYRGRSTFEGNITASGNISASGEVITNTLRLTPGVNDYITSTGTSVNIKSADSSINLIGNVTASSNISASGIVKVGLLQVEGLHGAGVLGSILTFGSETYPTAVDGSTIHLRSNITASGNISGSAAGTVSAGSGSFHVLKGDTTAATGLSVSGYIEATNITASGNISASGNITATGNIEATQITASHFSGNGSGLTNISVTLPTGILSSSNQIATSISGAFTAPSASFSTRVTNNDAKIGYTDTAVVTVLHDANVLSSSAQIASDISGSFIAASSSFSTRVTLNDAKVSYTDAAVTSVINTAGVLSSSAQLPTGIISSSLQDLGNITGSNISLSGTITANKFVGCPIHIIAHSWYMNQPDGTLANFQAGSTTYGWSDRAWNQELTKASVDSGTWNSNGDANLGVPLTQDIKNIKLVGTLKPTDATNGGTLSYFVYKMLAIQQTTSNSTNPVFICSGSSPTNGTQFNTIYITGSAAGGHEGVNPDVGAVAGDRIIVFSSVSNTFASGKTLKGTYTVTAEIA